MAESNERALAIVAVSAILPDAPDVDSFWRNVKGGRYSVSEVSPDRWDPALYYDPDHAAPEKTYSKIGGWVRDWEWDPMAWRLPIPPKVAEAMDESQRWAVACARALLLDYGHPERALDFERTAVVVGTAMAGDLHYQTALPVFFPEYAAALADAPSFAALPAKVREAITRESHERMSQRMPSISEDSMPGELANCIPGRIANVFDFHGPNFVCDAACASALAAIDAAHDGLLDGQYDAVVVGGVDRNMGPTPFVKFSKIGALSASGTRPYADGADGFVMGEGAAFFLLKRLADAEAAGDRVYAVLRGIGGSSDGRGKGITAPNPVGQRLAIERAWRDAGLSPASASLVEGHGTSTRVGDVVEVETLTGVFGRAGARPGSIALGSVKSNIGHLKGAAGAAGLLKVVKALEERVLPPSLNFERPNPNIDFAQSPLAVNTECKPWDTPPDGVRRAGLSAFGFGGTNFHAVVEEYIPGRLTARPAQSSVPDDVRATSAAVSQLKSPLRGALVLGEPSSEALRSSLDAVLGEARDGCAPAPEPPSEAALRARERLVIDYGDAAELVTKGERAAKVFAAPEEARPAMWKALRAQGIFRGSGPAPKIAFLYTGQGSQYPNMLADLRGREPIVAETFAEADRVMTPLLGHPLSDLLFVDPCDEAAVNASAAELRRTEITQPAVLTVDDALTRLLASYGVVPDLVMGHSLGEYGALVASGALPFPDALEAVSARGREMANLTIDDCGKMAAVFAPLEAVEALIESIDGNVIIANINSTGQAVIGGASEPMERAMQALSAADHKVVELPVSHAFHTSIVAPASEPLRRTLERLALAPPQTPIISNVSGDLYPMAPDAVPQMLDLLTAQVASPVQFVKGLRRLHEEGARIFVEVGPKRALQGFAADVLGELDDVVALFTNHPKQGDVTAFNQALCGIYAAGLGVGRREAQPVAAAAPAPAPVVQSASPSAAFAPGAELSADRYSELGQLFAEFMQRGAALLQGSAPVGASEPPVVTGASIGLPGRERVFGDLNVQHILDGEQEIDVFPTRFRNAILDKHITRLVKEGGGGPHFEPIESASDVIKLAGRAGKFDLEAEFGVPADRLLALDITTRLAIAAGLEAMHDAGLPLVLHYRTTTTGSKLPDRWRLPEPLRDETGVIFASVFPGYDAFAQELTRYGEDHSRMAQIETLRALRERAAEGGAADGVLRTELERRIHELEEEQAEKGYEFDRRFLFRVLAMGHSQFAEYIGARGPNTQVNSACASTTQAFAIAEDWIATGRCRRVIVIGADDATSDHMLEWIGAGFLASGAAATDDVVEEAALPFDRRRHGMILGMGAVGMVIEHPECARERGVRPICDVLSTVTANSAFHGTRLDVEHIGDVMERVVSQAEQRFGLDRRAIAPELLFVSHETYTPARGGSASAEVESLRRVFGEAADQIVVANTKGLTGHPMGAGVEDAVAIKALETGVVPPVPNYREVDPELGNLHLSKGGAYPIRYALRLGAGFGSQISMSLMRWTPTPDGTRPQADALGFETRIDDRDVWQAWLRDVSGDPAAELEVEHRTLRVVDHGPASRVEVRAPRAATPASSRGVAPATPVAPAAPAAHVTPAPVSAPSSPAAPAAAQSPPDADPDAAIRETVLGIVAEKTGYPADMLEMDLDLEADLGIDTVKQAETFAAIREAYDIPFDENLQLRNYPTLAHAVGFVKERSPSLAAVEMSPAPPSASTVDSAPAADPDAAIRETVLGIVAEKTGYPADMLEMDLDLEADLGIDTVKQAETFAAIREAYDIPFDENLQLRNYPTLAHAVGFVKERGPAFAAAGSSAGASPVESGTPPATEAPASASAMEPSAESADDEAAIRETVLGIVAEKTGYPADMLEMDLDLEADLGIDTVKQAETFAAIREAYDIPFDENLQLRAYPTLQHAIGFVKERRPAGAGAPQPAASAEDAAESSDHEPPGPSESELHWLAGSLEDAQAFPRRVPVAVLRPPIDVCVTTGVTLDGSSRVILMPDHSEVAHELTKSLEARGVKVLELDPGFDRDELVKQIESWLSEGPITGVYWLPALENAGDPLELDLAEWRAALELRVKLLSIAARCLHAELGRPGRFLVSATRMGGMHGLDEAGARAPLGGAVTGFTKALARELPEALVKAVDVAEELEPDVVAGALLDETLRDPGAVEIGHRDGARVSVALSHEAAEDGNAGLALGPQSVFVVTGAAGSIVSAIVADLASAAGGGHFHLLDLAPEPAPADPAIVLFESDREALKRQIFERLRESGERATPVMVDRELAGIERAHDAEVALRSVAQAGGVARYHQVDLTRADDVAKVIDSVREADGRIDVLVHAAGLEISRQLPDKPVEQYDLVFDVKADGWHNLLHAARDLPIGATVAFSSIAGRFGNAGQTDYAAANDLLCKCGSRLHADRPDTRAITIDWTAWADIGMASRGSIPEIMERAGIDMLPPAAGIAVVRRELTAGGRSGEVLIAGRLGVMEQERSATGGLDVSAVHASGVMLGEVKGMGLGAGLEIQTALDPATHPFLDHHRIDGTPVFPGVMGVEAFAEVSHQWAQMTGAAWHVVAAEDVEFLAPFKFYRDEPRALELSALFRRDGQEVVADCRLVGRRSLVGQSEPQVTEHFRARIRLAMSSPEAPQQDVPAGPQGPVVDAEDIYRIYFHGPAYRVLASAWRDGAAAIGRLADPLPDDLASGSPELITAPRLLELCFQTAGVREIGETGRMGLPQRISRVEWFGAPDPERPGVCARVETQPDGSSHAVVLDAQGRVLLRMLGYATAALPVDVPADLRAPLCEGMT